MADEMKLSTKQWVSLLTAAIMTSGAGGAITVSASDRVQDSKIETVKSEVDRLRDGAKETLEEVVKLRTQTEQIQETQSELRQDVKEIRRLLNEVLSEVSR